ncbi:MAG: hypothetical protein ACP5H9_05050, partial [Candidatus Woesearchaeota archaeon]
AFLEIKKDIGSSLLNQLKHLANRNSFQLIDYQGKDVFERLEKLGKRVEGKNIDEELKKLTKGKKDVYKELSKLAEKKKK